MKHAENNYPINKKGEVRALKEVDFARMKTLKEAVPNNVVKMALNHQAEMENQGLMPSQAHSWQTKSTN
ncbi:hypothetical protein [Histophilus somni]|uniref:hypothetical protein n=1 Tax=Histophilus somni TaxID=731 RepID=UPI00201F9C38|nr:hypothetical protein [Histophilus somni]